MPTYKGGGSVKGNCTILSNAQYAAARCFRSALKVARIKPASIMPAIALAISVYYATPALLSLYTLGTHYLAPALPLTPRDQL